MNIDCFPLVLNKLCESYLTPEELIYYFGDWYKLSRDQCFILAAKFNLIDLFEWTYINHQHDILTRFKVCDIAAEHGHLTFLRIAHEKGYPMDYRTYNYAIDNGHLDVAKWIQTINTRYLHN